MSAILLQPIIPAKAAELLDRLGVEEGQRGWEAVLWSEEAGEVDVDDVRTRLERGAASYQGKGPLFPPVKV